MQADDRRIAEVHYKLSLTLHFLDDPETALKHARAAIDVCNARIFNLSKTAGGSQAAPSQKPSDGPAAATPLPAPTQVCNPLPQW